MRSAHRCSESPFKWFLKSEDGYFRSLQQDCSNDAANLPRQAFPEVFIPNGYVDIIRPEQVRLGSLYGEKMLAFVTEPCQEVDCQEDIPFLEYQLRASEYDVFDYLKTKV